MAMERQRLSGSDRAVTAELLQPSVSDQVAVTERWRRSINNGAAAIELRLLSNGSGVVAAEQE